MRFFRSIFNILRFNKKNWKAVVLCILAATVFWCFNALSKRYSTALRFPIEFDYDRESYIPVRPLPKEVRMNVTSVGWNLLRRSTGVRVTPLVVSLDRPSEVKNIVASTLTGILANQLGGFEINFVLTDTLHVAIEPKGTRRVRVEADVADILFRKEYGLTGPVSIIPDTVRLEGPLNLLRALPDPILVKVDQRDIDEDFSEPVALRFLNDELIHRDPETVNIAFRVDKMVEVTDSAHLKVANAPRHSWPYIERLKIPCTVVVPERARDGLNMDSVFAVVDLTGITRGSGTRKIMPRLEGLPDYSQVIRLDSISIKF